MDRINYKQTSSAKVHFSPGKSPAFFCFLPYFLFSILKRINIVFVEISGDIHYERIIELKIAFRSWNLSLTEMY